MGFLSRLFFTNVRAIVKLARTKIVDEKDLLELPESFNPRISFEGENRIRWTTPVGYLLSSIAAMRPYLVPGFLWLLGNTIFALVSPLLVNLFITQISEGVTAETLPRTIVFGILLGVCGFLAGFCIQHYFFIALGSNQILTNILNRRIFAHSLKLSLQARQKNQVGDIVNHMSSDTDSIADFPLVILELFVSILMVTGVVGMLFYYLGHSTWAALAVLLTLAPLTKYVAKHFTHFDEEMMKHRDHRVNLMTQALNAIRVVKYFAWEKSVAKEVQDVRGKELLSRRRLARAEVVATLAYMSVSTFVLVTALGVHAWRGQELSAALLFTTIALFGLLEEPFGSLSRHLSRLMAAKVASRRILEFLSQEQVSVIEENPGELHVVRLRDLQAQYQDQTRPALQGLNLELRSGESLAVVGPVGSGKSSLLQALLGELPLKSGDIEFTNAAGEKIRPSRAFVSQEAFIMNGSLLDNMTFGAEASGEDIRTAVRVSCLEKDIRELKGGLRTEIGEKGVNLSGGQKQRVALARAYLSKASLLLLDDPLSAVDVETESLLCERLLFGAWKDQTRVVVTHRLEHLDRFDQILYLENGEVKGHGTFAKLLASSPGFSAFYSEHRATHGEVESAPMASPDGPAAASTLEQEEVRVTDDEDREVGAVKSRVYWDYIQALGGDTASIRKWILLGLLVGSMSVALLPLAQKAWLSYYTSNTGDWTTLHAVAVFAVLGFLVLLATMGNHLFWLSRGISAGQSMHDRMLKSVLRAPVRFFDSTPVGRILQRFSRDVESVDLYLQWTFDSAVHCILQVVVSLFLILGVLPVMVLVIGPVMTLYYFLQRDYRRPAREIKRLDSVARSPRYAHFKESLQGLSVIRGFNRQSWFMEGFYDRLAHSQRTFYTHYYLNRWFSIRIPFLGGIVSTMTAVVIAYGAYRGWITAGVAGLLVLYSLSFWSYLNWGVRIFSDMESRMTSIERMKFFADLPGELDTVVARQEPLPPEWPSRGEIKVQDLQVRYAPHLPLVLKGLSFEVKAGSRVGLIGRTGSGKSTFFQSLFRFVEAEKGRIEIDGVNIGSVCLEKLRRSMAIIPQDPTLFMGTIRNNLDRYDEYSDEQIQNALEKASMADFVRSLPAGLSSPVSESGHNLSQGQRQLLCLARALLTEARVIVMDEATASVDVKTDALLQKVIRESLQDVTLIIIAHRLGTVEDCDQIVELSMGEVKTIRRPEEITAAEIEESLV